MLEQRGLNESVQPVGIDRPWLWWLSIAGKKAVDPKNKCQNVTVLLKADSLYQCVFTVFLFVFLLFLYSILLLTAVLLFLAIFPTHPLLESAKRRPSSEDTDIWVRSHMTVSKCLHTFSSGRFFLNESHIYTECLRDLYRCLRDLHAH